MKFDYIIGNPPYQEQISDESGNSSLSKQLFPAFIQAAIETGADKIALITPSRWFAGDAQDKSFVKLREFIQDNNHIRTMYNYKNAKEVFPNTEIKGGVNYFLYDKRYKGKVRFVNVEKDEERTEIRNLFEEGLDIIISDAVNYSILSKVKEYRNFVSLTAITTGRNAFGIIGKAEVVEEVSQSDKFDGAIELRCKNNIIRWTERKYISKGLDIVDKYKVYISKSAGSPGKDMKIIGMPYLGGKKSVCTDSLFPIGKFETKEEAENLLLYMKTKFLRYIVSIVKMSQNVTQIVYKFVPMQDFSSKSDLNWNVSVELLDKQLFEKYGFTQDEIDIIQTSVKEME